VSDVVVWDTELAAQRAREAYRYVARVYPKDAPWSPSAVRIWPSSRPKSAETGKDTRRLKHEL
jgi:hypothetical protein